jgi:hypothetical protein
MSRNWSAAVPGGPTDRHVSPPFRVRTTVPRLPLAHAVRSLIAERPRSRAFVPVGFRSHE